MVKDVDAKTEPEPLPDAKIVCANCGAEYDQLPSFRCPRCGNALCSSGCDGCSGCKK
jgi:predicted amidophosphoribosyltransferase